ncbi:MAG: SUMF1/EgtB/PvdO family nonheme iron enzyme [Lentisphaeria bacterium]|nr:SUMF1/EgtB/PvdO family nonheme iron enzyme [Lentisphaeria bacterium]
MKRISFTAVIAGVTLIGIAGSIEAAPRRANPDAKLHRYSTTIEKERPQLNEETKRLIAAYRRDPGEANYAALKKQVERNYDAVVARKKAKLEELKRTARDQYKVEEMQNIVDEMLRDRYQRVENSMRRFTDQRFRPGLRNRSADGYQQVLGAGQNVSIGYAPVTNEDYAKFIAATGRTAPRTWKNGRMPESLAKHPVVNISYEDAIAYCKYLTDKNGGHATYRLPTEAEWEAAAGHMPKDADFNCGENDGTTPVNAYAKTISACGAVDMWGNVWEWTSTAVGSQHAVKGGAWDSRRTDCRTEARGVGRDPDRGHANVGFRVVRESKENNGNRSSYRRGGRRSENRRNSRY